LVPNGAKGVDDELVVERLRWPVDTGTGASVDEVPAMAKSWLQLCCPVVVEWPGASVEDVAIAIEDIGPRVCTDEMPGKGWLQLCSPICVGTGAEGKTPDVV
jgi:hypothetical protein